MIRIKLLSCVTMPTTLLSVIFFCVLLTGINSKVEASGPEYSQKYYLESQYENNNSINKLEERLNNIEIKQTKIQIEKSEYNYFIDRRISDLQNRIGDINLYFGWFTTVVALISILIGLVSFFTVRGRAESLTREWIEQYGPAQIDPVVQNAIEKIDMYVSDTELRAKDAQKDILNISEKLSNIDRNKLTKQEEIELESKIDTLVNTPQANWKYTHWYLLGLKAALQENEFAAAAYFFRQAASAPDAGTKDKVLSLFARGAALQEMKDYSGALENYNEVLNKFSDVNDIDIIKFISMCFISKGISEQRMGLDNEAIDTFSHVISKYKNSKDSDLQDRVAMAFMLKGASFSSLNRISEANGCFNEIITRYNNPSTDIQKDVLSKAYSGRGINSWAAGDKETSKDDFEKAMNIDKNHLVDIVQSTDDSELKKVVRKISETIDSI